MNPDGLELEGERKGRRTEEWTGTIGRRGELLPNEDDFPIG
jgi:hypothetical protein